MNIKFIMLQWVLSWKRIWVFGGIERSDNTFLVTVLDTRWNFVMYRQTVDFARSVCSWYTPSWRVYSHNSEPFVGKNVGAHINTTLRLINMRAGRGDFIPCLMDCTFWRKWGSIESLFTFIVPVRNAYWFVVVEVRDGSGWRVGHGICVLKWKLRS